MRQLSEVSFDSRTYTDENVLYDNELVDPVQLSMQLTYLYGKDSDMFPLLSMTEGQGLVKSQKPKMMNDTQYVYPIMGRMKHTSKVVGLASATVTEPGKAFTPFEVIFEDNWFIKQYGVISPDGQHLCRVQGEGKSVGTNRVKYTLMIQGGDETEFVTMGNFLPGKAWVMAAPTIPASKSDGNRANSIFPGEMTNQFGFHRYSKHIAGNVSNKVTVIEFDLDDGTTTNMWMPFDMKIWEMDRRLMNETDLWYSKYNRNDQGRITLFDDETGEPIPRGAGVKEVIEAVGNYDTYSILTVSKIDSWINTIFANRVDDTPMEIVLYTGAGGKRMFHEALMSDATAKMYYQALGDNVISGGEYLSYGKYFNQYKTIDGKVITVRETNLFNHGPIAEQQRMNGDLHDGFPIESYNLVFLDHSMSGDGERNIQLVAEQGRELITGIYKGMSPLPASWGALESKILSTRKDIATYEVIDSQGIAIKNATTSFWGALAL